MMVLDVDPGVAALLGSRTRVRVLAPLANAFNPLSAYRIAQLAQLPRTKVYLELRRLARAGEVEESPTPRGTSVWSLKDPDLARLLRRRVRVGWSEDLKLASPQIAARTKSAIEAYRRNPIDPALLRVPSRPRNRKEFDRLAEKDASLRRLGLRPAGRSNKRR